MTLCQQFKQRLIDEGLTAIKQDRPLIDHIQSCATCSQLLAHYEAIPELLDQLPEHQPSDELLERTTAAVTAPPVTSTKQPWHRQLAAGLATAVVMLAVLGLSIELMSQDPSSKPLGGRAPASVVVQSELAEHQQPAKTAVQDLGAAVLADRRIRTRAFRVDPNRESPAQSVPEIASGKQDTTTQDQDFGTEEITVSAARAAPPSTEALDIELEEIIVTGNRIASDLQDEPLQDPDDHFDAQSIDRSQRARDIRQRIAEQRKALRDEAKQRSTDPLQDRLAETSISTEPAQPRRSGTNLNSDGVGDVLLHPAPSGGFTNDNENAQQELVLADSSAPASGRGIRLPLPQGGVEEVMRIESGSTPMLDDQPPSKDRQLASKAKKDLLATPIGISDTQLSPVDFLEHYQQTDGVPIQSAEGYWANQYVPGDPQIKLLRARLAAWDRSALGEDWRLEQDVRPLKQPFDTPENNALALSLMSDANAVDGPTRLRLQVGIRGIQHLRGQRPALNLGVVLDLPTDADDSVRTASRALLDALLASKQAGDRFSVLLRGAGEPVIISPEEFRFGPLQLFNQAILEQSALANISRISLRDSMAQAAEMVRSGADQSQPLGSSAILLISARQLKDIDQLVQFAHQQAREGITLSAIPLGNAPNNADVQRLVLAGLGNRRYLQSPAQAASLIDQELQSAGSAVARAARLSIRLAPGVKLVEVIGSQRLDTDASRRVKEIETTMDQRLRSNLGIEADRGDDEDGIQIIIPSVFADDSLTVLIDVIAERAGPIADVSLRYKDVIYKKNGSLRSRLVLDDGAMDRGPAELTVLKNLLAHHFRQSVERAANALANHQPAQANSELTQARDLLIQLQNQLPAWRNDPELLHDLKILRRYISVLQSPQGASQQPLLSDSLRYAAWAKTHQATKEYPQ